MIFHNLLLGHFIEELTTELHETGLVFLRRYKDERYKKYLFVSPTGDIQLHVSINHINLVKIKKMVFAASPLITKH